jgi:RNAse (barnase) inhibitor barstar
MRNWAKLFRSHSSSGVYVIEPDAGLSEIEKAARSCGLLFFTIDLTGIDAKDAFMLQVSKTFNFPSYFGMNWDAFEECITDLSWYPAKGYVVVFNKLAEFTQNARQDMITAREIFEAAASSWRKKRIGFYILLVEQSVK